MNDNSTGAYRCAALFVDFENVYIGLSNSSKDAGERFATQPDKWVEWMEKVLGPFLVEMEEKPRAILRRICYLDPQRSGKFRPYFTRAGFRVVDCPTLTGQGKNSADIYMVLDILDTLVHPVRYDEFIVLSVDADFTPVLLRLREHDRRTAMLLSGPAAAALKAACDFVIPDSMFLDEALGLGEEENEPIELQVPSRATSKDDRERVRQLMEAVVRKLLADATIPVAMAKAAHEVRAAVGKDVDDTAWAGCGSFGEFIDTLKGENLKIDKSRSPGWLYDPGRHTLPERSDVAALPSGLGGVAARVSKIVGVPLLPTEHYATLFDVLAADARAIGRNGQVIAE